MKLNKITAVGGRIAKIRFGIVATLVGLLFCVLGGFVIYNGSNKEAKYEPVSATITSVVGQSDISEGEFDVEISYVVDGVTYSGSIISSSSTVGDSITIYFDINNPNNISTSADGGKFLPVIIIVIGVLVFVFGIYTLVRSFTEKLDKLQQVDMAQVSEEEIEAIKNSEEPTKEYYFHFTGKMNQSYILETVNRDPVISINCDKIGIVSKFKFTFKNELTGKEVSHEVTHTTTESYGGNGFMIPAKSTFKIDGVDVFKMIADMGYSIVSKIEGLRLNFDVCHYGVEVATLRSSGSNVQNGNKSYGKLGDIPTVGVYTINAKESDLDAVALVAFAVSRVEFF